jgi:hypothetical protein
MDTIDLMQEGFRRATTRAEKVHEAASLFARGRNGSKPLAQAVLLEAFSTSDFPVLLGDAFEKQALKAYQDTPLEFESILTDTTVDDFERRKLVDLWGATEFAPVGEGEEYKSGRMQETEIEHASLSWRTSPALSATVPARPRTRSSRTSSPTATAGTRTSSAPPAPRSSPPRRWTRRSRRSPSAPTTGTSSSTRRTSSSCTAPHCVARWGVSSLQPASSRR